jgi:hypothetical protein
VPWEGGSLLAILDGDAPDGWESTVRAVKVAAFELGGYPVFLRTGCMSGKHAWLETCHVPGPDDVQARMATLVREQATAFGVPPVGEFVVRELLDLETGFRAFRGRMPVNTEVRAFVDGDEPVCLHPYWPEEAIYGASRQDWRVVLREMQDIEAGDRGLLLELSAALGGHRLQGAWSVDWARHRDGRWFLIDMAPAGMSYHAPECEHADRWEDPREGAP